jgi:[ribosomal protein S18]-alanine N-acetyltransferase
MIDSRVRRMVEEDVAVVHALDVASFTLPWPLSAYQFEVSRNPDSLPLVIEVKDGQGNWRIAGVMVIWLILDEAHIGTIAIDAEYRRKGLARRLLGEGLLLSHTKGAVAAYLEVRRGNIGAQELYRQFGFTIEGVRARYYQDNHEDALLLTLKPLIADWIESLIR